MNLGISENVKPLLAEVRRFIEEEVLPVDHEYAAEVAVGDRWQYTDRQTEIREGLKAKAKAKGLWNFFLTDGDSGSGLNTVEYAYLAEEMGKSHLAAQVFNCAAPDTGNMEAFLILKAHKIFGCKSVESFPDRANTRVVAFPESCRTQFVTGCQHASDDVPPNLIVHGRCYGRTARAAII